MAKDKKDPKKDKPVPKKDTRPVIDQPIRIPAKPGTPKDPRRP